MVAHSDPVTGQTGAEDFEFETSLVMKPNFLKMLMLVLMMMVE